MTLLTLLALWLAVSIPFALLVGAAIRLADEREGHLERAGGGILPLARSRWPSRSPPGVKGRPFPPHGRPARPFLTNTYRHPEDR